MGSWLETGVVASLKIFRQRSLAFFTQNKDSNMVGTKRKISLNCSLPLPNSMTKNLNTPEILDTVLNMMNPVLGENSPEDKKRIKVELADTVENQSCEKRIKTEVAEIKESEEERRRKRRERNKIAATKCRNKKKEQTANLLKESEAVKSFNRELKLEMIRLEHEEKQLKKVLEEHKEKCVNEIKIEQVSIETTCDSDRIRESEQRSIESMCSIRLEAQVNDEQQPQMWIEHQEIHESEFSQKQFSFFQNSFDAFDSSCASQSGTSSKFFDAGTRFIVL